MANNLFDINFEDDNSADTIDLSEYEIPSLDSDGFPGNTPAPAAPAPDAAPTVKVVTPTPTPPAPVEDDFLDLDELLPTTPSDTTSSTPDSESDPAVPAATTASSPYSSLATLFHERGVISDIEKFKDVKTIDDFVEVFQTTLHDGVLSEMTDEQKNYLEAVKAGVPTQWYHDKTSVLNQFNKVNEAQLIADTEQAKQVRFNLIYNEFVAKGHDAEEAKQLATDLFQLGRDKDLSKKALANAKVRLQAEINDEIAAKQAEQDAEINNQKKNLDTIKEKIYNSAEIFPGVKWTKPVQDKVFKTATTIVGYDKQNRPLTPLFKALHDNPIDTQIKMSYLWAITNEGKDIKSLMSKASSKVAKEVEELIIAGSIGGDISEVQNRIPASQSTASLISGLNQLGIGAPK